MTLRDEFGSLLPGEASAGLARRAKLLTAHLAAAEVPPALAFAGTVHGYSHRKSFTA